MTVKAEASLRIEGQWGCCRRLRMMGPQSEQGQRRGRLPQLAFGLAFWLTDGPGLARGRQCSHARHRHAEWCLLRCRRVPISSVKEKNRWRRGGSRVCHLSHLSIIPGCWAGGIPQHRLADECRQAPCDARGWSIPQCKWFAQGGLQ